MPIPGTKRTARVDENVGAVDVALSADEVAQPFRRVCRPGRRPAGAIPTRGMKAVYL